MTSARDTFWRRLRWPLISVVLTIALAVSRVAVNPRFYFADDTERGSFGQWWSLGEHLSRGTLPILDPSAWQGGNYFAEGQWGILSPVTWLIGLTAYVTPDAALHVTAWKILFLAIFAIGMYLMCREFGASRPWAALAATLAPAAGFTVYMDAASWSTGLFDSCLLPLVWWTLRRAVEHGKSPIPLVITSFTLVTFGYVFGVIVLVVLLVETLVRHIVLRDRVRILRTLAASAWGGLWTIVVYLPAMMTSAVTTRSEAPYENTGFLNADISDLFSSASPLTVATIQSFEGAMTSGPLVYIAWILPLLPLFLPIPRANVTRLLPVWIYGAFALAFIIAPSDLGAIRWPLRMMPYVVIAALIVFSVAATKAFPERITRGRAWAAVGLIAAMAYVSWIGEMWAWKAIALGAALQIAAVIAVVLIAQTRDTPFVPGRASSWEKKTAFVVACAMLVTMGVGAAQLMQWRESPLPSVNAPTGTDELRDVLGDVEGDAIVVGNYMKGAGTPESWDERLMANLWYISDANVSSVYTVLPFSAYASDLCSDLRGLTCKSALETLWSNDEETGLPVADLLSVSTILVAKYSFDNEPTPPEGWHLGNDGGWMWQFERDEPLPSAGGVVWSGEGTEVTETDETQTTVTFTVDAVGDDARVALSRLPFPGYSVSGAELADPVRDYLLTVDVTGLEAGDQVTVRFLPPPFPVLAGSFVLAWLVLAGWLIARGVVRRRESHSA